jgi:hypothetical protein
VDELRQAYEAWWSDCGPDPEAYSRIPIGDPATEIVRLTAHDWHGNSPPWDQSMIRQSPATNGHWEITVARPGNYQFWIARQPLAEPRPLECRQVTLRVGELEASVSVDPSAVLAPISLQLPAGPATLTTQLVECSDGKERGAFFVYASYVSPDAALAAQPAALPEWLSPGDRIAWLGGTLIERGGDTGQLEAQWLARAVSAGLTFCNLGWSGDDVRGRARNVFGDITEGKTRRERDLDLAAPSVVVVA